MSIVMLRIRLGETGATEGLDTGQRSLAEKSINYYTAWFLMVDDMAALQTTNFNRKQLPENGSGHAVIDVPNEEEIQTHKSSIHLKLRWEVNPHPDPEGVFLILKVKALP